MRQKSKIPPLFLALYIANIFPSHAFASGFIANPPQSKEYNDYRQCALELKKTYKQHKAFAAKKPLAKPNIKQEIEFNSPSKGVKKIGHNKAQYEARIWYHNRFLNTQTNAYEISHSYTDYKYLCDGKTMFINGGQGYTLSTFEEKAKN